MNSKRIEWIDITKGIAILMVLYGHCMRDEMRLSYPFLDYTYRCVYVFHMAFFFWLSGYSYQMGRTVFRKTYDKSFVIKKVKKQIVPWILYSICIYILFSIAMHIDSISAVLLNSGYQKIPVASYILNSLCANNNWSYHLWFIYVLFLISIVIFLFDTVSNYSWKTRIGLLLFCIIGLFWIRLVNLGNFERILNYLFLYIPFYVIGSLMQDKIDCIKHTTFWGSLGIIYILVRAKFFSGFSGNSVKIDNIFFEMLVWYSAYLFLPGTFLLMRKLGIKLSKSKNRFSELISKCGEHSFVIYLFHQPFCCAFIGTLLYSKLNLNPFFVMTVCMAFSLIVPAGLLYFYNTIRKYFFTERTNF